MFLISKSRVSPLVKLTGPRLELQAEVLPSRIRESIRAECRFEFERTIYFSDSTIVLAWIKNDARTFKSFVSTRIGEIQMKSEPHEWRHCPSESNVADDLSRGVTADELQGRWINGPEFLTIPEEDWPRMTVHLNQLVNEVIDSEKKQGKFVWDGSKMRNKQKTRTLTT